MSTLVRALFAAAVLLLCTLLPFLPGRHDPFAMPLSQLALFMSWAALLLVPVGLAWLAYELTRRDSARTSPSVAMRRRFAIAAIVVAAVLSLLAIIGGFAAGGLVLAAAMLLGGAATFRAVVRHSDGEWRAQAAPFVAVPLALVVTPPAVLAIQRAIATTVYESTRDRAIRNADRMIAEIERHRAANGRYPVSLLSIWGDHDPMVAGIGRYHYEPSGDAYNLAFEQPTFVLGLREFIVYNPRDAQVMTSHDQDLLELRGEALERQRGFFASGPAGHPHWKYFRFD